MRTPKKVWRGIARKLKNRKGNPTTSKEAAMEESRTMPEDVEEVKVEVKEQTSVDKATETDTQLREDINENNEDLQPACESREEAQNASVDTATQEPNVSNDPCSAEIKPCFDSDATNGKDKPSTKATQAIIAGSAGIVLLVSSIVSYILKMHVIAVVGEIIGLACISFALYNILKPNTKLEKVEDIEQPNVQSFLNPI
jgi:hypothetical protein